MPETPSSPPVSLQGWARQSCQSRRKRTIGLKIQGILSLAISRPLLTALLSPEISRYVSIPPSNPFSNAAFCALLNVDTMTIEYPTAARTRLVLTKAKEVSTGTKGSGPNRVKVRTMNRLPKRDIDDGGRRAASQI